MLELKDSNDIAICRIKCIALIQIHSYYPCQTFIESLSQNTQQKLLFYHCYCLYAQKKNEQSKELIDKNSNIIQSLPKNEKNGIQSIQNQLVIYFLYLLC